MNKLIKKIKEVYFKFMDWIKRPFMLLSTDDAGGGGDTGGTPQTPPATPAVDIEKIKAEARAEAEAAFKEEQKKVAERAKLDETERLKQEKADLEKKLSDMEAGQKKLEYEGKFRDAANSAGASKVDALLKLADSSLSPGEAVEALKKDYPELFTKAPSAGDVGAGATGGQKGANKTADDISKMSIDEYKQWRKANK